MAANNAAKFTKDYISKHNRLPSRQDVWNAATKSAESRVTDTEQLKAEIAALVTEMLCDNGRQTRIDWLGVIDKLRQLSAV